MDANGTADPVATHSILETIAAMLELLAGDLDDHLADLAGDEGRRGYYVTRLENAAAAISGCAGALILSNPGAGA